MAILSFNVFSYEENDHRWRFRPPKYDQVPYNDPDAHLEYLIQEFGIILSRFMGSVFRAEVIEETFLENRYRAQIQFPQNSKPDIVMSELDYFMKDNDMSVIVPWMKTPNGYECIYNSLDSAYVKFIFDENVNRLSMKISFMNSY